MKDFGMAFFAGFFMVIAIAIIFTSNNTGGVISGLGGALKGMSDSLLSTTGNRAS